MDEPIVVIDADKAWYMYRIWMPYEKQVDFVRLLCRSEPDFPYSFNRYFGIYGERDHVQFRFPMNLHQKAVSWLADHGYASTACKEGELWLTHANTTQTAMVASKCAVEFCRMNDSFVRPNPMVMMDFLHFFLDGIGHSYYDEEALYNYAAAFWKTRREFKAQYEGTK